MPFSRPDPFLPGRHRALVVLRFLLNTTEETDRIWPNPTTPCYLTNYNRSAETGEIFGLVLRVLAVVGLLLVTGCARPSDPNDGSEDGVISGSTMGTYYRVAIESPGSEIPFSQIADEIEALLADINRQMSTYDPDSEISRFNQSDSLDWFPVSPNTAHVVEKSLAISRQTGGAFDVTVGPLVNLWGFGPAGRRDTIPSAREIEEARNRVGFAHLEARSSPPAIKKGIGELYVDLSAIAKGFAVDQISDYLSSIGMGTYLVDIGGELRARGTKADSTPWRVAIERPQLNRGSVQRIVSLSEGAIATSGDYRNFFEIDGVRYSHEIDPVKARPITHSVASVTVLTNDCTMADAWSTALMILGPDAGYQLALQEQLAALFIVKSGHTFIEKATPLFPNRVRNSDVIN